jgi:hypothetical protein
MVLSLALAGCDDERPTMPPSTDAWRAADLPYLNLGSSLDAIAFSGDAGYILGSGLAKAGTSYLLLERDPERHWRQQRLADPPDNAVLVDLALGANGLALGGYLQQELDPCLVYDERGEVPAAIARAGDGMAAIDGDDALMVAGGTARGGALWLSREPGRWSSELTPLSQFHQGGYTDVFVAQGRAWACGFDDGSDTPPLLLALEPAGGTWARVPLGPGLLGRELQCVAATGDGALLLGGITGGVATTPRPFLRLREAGGDWIELALPGVEFIGAVNDLLPNGDGSWFAACGGVTGPGGAGLGTILRVSGRVVTIELTPFHGAVLQLARDADGLPHAVGYRLSAGASLRQPLLLTRG